MSRSSIAVAALLAAATLGAPPAPGAERFEVGIVEPLAGRPLFGEIEVVVEVRGAPAVRVELEVDGRAAGERTAPPWRFHVDVGEENAPHRLLAVAHGADGRRRGEAEPLAIGGETRAQCAACGPRSRPEASSCSSIWARRRARPSSV